MKCTQYGICGEVAFKNARAKVFLEAGQRFSGGFRKFKFLCGATTPNRIFLPERLVGGRISSSFSGPMPREFSNIIRSQSLFFKIQPVICCALLVFFINFRYIP